MMIVDEIFIPKRRIVIANPEQIQHYISVYNGKKNIYQSVYHYKNKPSAINAIVDKVFLDFDYDDDLKFYDDVKKVAKYLHKHGIRFYIRFSGRGFHIFVMVQNNLKQPKLSNGSTRCIGEQILNLTQLLLGIHVVCVVY